MSEFVPSTGFTAGFASRHDAVAQALQQAFAAPVEGFAPVDIRARFAGPSSFSPQGDGPKHFHPADPGTNPTEGWDPFEPNAEQAATSSGTSFVDPLETAHAAGYAEGMAAALAEIAANSARDRALIAQLAAELKSEGRFDREQMAQRLRQTVMFLVTRLVGETGIAPDLLARRIASASDMIADSAESVLLRVHPGDVALLDGLLPRTVFAAGDASVARGSFVLESASTIIEDGPELWLEQLAQAIDHIAVPPA